MLTPTIFITLARCLGGNRFDPQLTKLKGWFSKQVAENTPLLIGAVGIVMVLYSTSRLF